MKKWRPLLFTLLALLLLIGIPTAWLMREYRRERASWDLIAAIKAEDTARALTALRAGADPNIRTHFSFPWEGLPEDTPPSFGEQMKQFLDNLFHPTVKSNQDDQTALLLHLDVSKEGNPILLKALLDGGADPNTSGGINHETPLLLVASEEDTSKTLGILLAYGANVSKRNDDGLTPLHRAASWGDATMIQLLLDAGADIEAQDNEGDTPLQYASTHQNGVAAEALLCHHANVNNRNKHGTTPLDEAMTPTVRNILRKAGAKTGKELDAQSATPRNAEGSGEAFGLGGIQERAVNDEAGRVRSREASVTVLRDTFMDHAGGAGNE
jgi:ankyrin repeat protein